MADDMNLSQVVNHIEKKMEEFTGKVSTDAKNEYKQMEAQILAYKEEVKNLNTELGSKGATLGEIQEEIKELKAKGGRIIVPKRINRRLPESVKTGILEDNIIDLVEEKGISLLEEVKKVNPQTGKDGIEIKAVADMSSANLSGDVYQSYLPWQLGMGPRGGTHFRDLVRTIQSATDYVQFPRENTPRGEGSFGRQVTEGTAKPKVDYDFTMVDVTLTAIAGYCIVSRQALRNIPFLQSYLPQTMMEDLLEYEDADFSGKLIAAATGSTTTAGITVTADRMIHFMKNMFIAKHRISAFVVDPLVWANLLIFRPGTDNPYSLPSVTTVDPSGNIRLMGIPIIPVSWLTGGRIIAGDWTKVAIVESEGLQFRQSDSHASTFIANQITFLLERTEDVAIFRPEAFMTTTLT